MSSTQPPPILHFGIFEARVGLVEYLVRRGAKLDDAAREAAEGMMLNPYGVRPGAHRVLEICGGRALEVLRRERDERYAKRVMLTSPIVEEAFVFAKPDAVQAGMKAVSPSCAR